MRGNTHLLQLACGLALATPAQAVRHDSQFWGTLNGTAKLGKWRLSEEIVTRFSDHKDGLYEIESNTMASYVFSDKLTLGGGYTHDPQYSAGHFTVMEHRAREQASFGKLARFAGGIFDARFRMEERWREGANGTGWRVRPYVRYVRPFSKGGKTNLIISHESFINLNSTSFQSHGGYDRMRNLIGVSTPLSKGMVIGIGYLNQYTFVRGGEDTMDHVALLSIGMTFDAGD